MSPDTKETNRPQIICAPVLTFTQSDANIVAEKCPYELEPDAENMIYVSVNPLTKIQIESRKSSLFCSHFIRKKDGTSAVKSEWEIEVPINQTVNKNVFYVDIKL